MGITESISKEQILKQLKAEIFDVKFLILKHINDIFARINYQERDVFYYLKKDIVNGIESIFSNKNREIEQNLPLKEKNPMPNKREKTQLKNNCPISDKDSSSEKNEIQNFNFFTSKDIQNKNLEITIDFENYYTNFISDTDSLENKTVAEFLLKVANLSRLSYNLSNKFLKNLYKEYKEIELKDKKNKIIVCLDQFKKEFSIWVKNNEDEVNIKLINFLNKCDLSFINKQEDKQIKIYFKKLFKDLLILYFRSELSFPSIEINFKKEEDCFNYKKMIDLLNKGNNRKVNFVFLPSLFSNGIYLENGRQWVFTYINNPKKKTFFFKDKEIELFELENAESKFHIPTLSEELKIQLKTIYYLVPKLNYDISEKVNQEYIYYLKNKKTNKTEKYVKNGKIEINDNLEFLQCEFNLMGEKILEISELIK